MTRRRKLVKFDWSGWSAVGKALGPLPRQEIPDSRCEYLHWRDGRCDKCGHVHDGKLPVVNFPIPSQGTEQ